METTVQKEKLIDIVKGKSIHFVGQVSQPLIDMTKLFWVSNASISISTKQEDVSQLPTHLAIFNYKENTDSKNLNQKLAAHFSAIRKPLSLICVNHENDTDIFERLTIAKDLLHSNEGSAFINFVALDGSLIGEETHLVEKIQAMDTALKSVGLQNNNTKTVYYSNADAVYSKPLYKLVEHILNSNDELTRYCLLDSMAFVAHEDGLGGKIELNIKPSRKDSW